MWLIANFSKIFYLLIASLFAPKAILVLANLFSNKKTLLTGPPSSGKTTFLQYISKDEIPKEQSGVPKSYKVQNAFFDVVTDFSGDTAWLNGKFDQFINDHDYILFFFDVSEYINTAQYRSDVNARIDMINRNINRLRQIVLLVGTHIDCVSGEYKSNVEQFFAGKEYANLLNKIVYIDTRKKGCVEIIFDELKS